MYVLVVSQMMGVLLSPGALSSPALPRHRRGQQLVHEVDVCDGESQGLYPRQSLLIGKCGDLRVFYSGSEGHKLQVPTLDLSLSKASFKLNIRLLSLVLAALL